MLDHITWQDFYGFTKGLFYEPVFWSVIIFLDERLRAEEEMDYLSRIEKRIPQRMITSLKTSIV